MYQFGCKVALVCPCVQVLLKSLTVVEAFVRLAPQSVTASRFDLLTLYTEEAEADPAVLELVCTLTFVTAVKLRVGHMAQCAAHAPKGLVCHARGCARPSRPRRGHK